jgi:HNH endonuclease
MTTKIKQSAEIELIRGLKRWINIKLTEYEQSGSMPISVSRTNEGYGILNTPFGSIPFHRFVAEWFNGRSLKPTEHVHHIDGDKSNNYYWNLEILNASEHAKETAIQKKLHGGWFQSYEQASRELKQMYDMDEKKVERLKI